ncbi:MAG: hypothetical protein UX18_C0001G0010 [Candidatus Azambacteria bacterium GW2011_GWC2_45_7b]|uniref:Uncharacterized protein n=1 Tax=Candidatus Azambacteria bacterium GW2011_GWC2_45_7b TaxID=1618621 RepID=A0A837IJE8_9BACT|nr:MAG: hypothetical protein UW15_C0001G0010 [Parcubacteria group bacterium GW2011_GWC1_44_10]KKU13119.1 MAG: hypothetical protein UX18_C0001G0010 [Candidatus Azambacteria bacterium GW2011_GWC2_45_7b]
MINFVDAMTNFYILGALLAIGIILLVILAKKSR